ncbi:MAG: CDGSH iron-sulfur domain-containing protein [bacterium]
MSDHKKDKPAVFELEAGTYYYCTCGMSDKQPFCNGAHKGSTLAPKAFEIKEKTKVALCQCKETKNPPFCDGSHKKK